MKNIQYTDNMYQYLVWRLFQTMYGIIEWCKKEEKSIAKFTDSAAKKFKICLLYF